MNKSADHVFTLFLHLKFETVDAEIFPVSLETASVCNI